MLRVTLKVWISYFECYTEHTFGIKYILSFLLCNNCHKIMIMGGLEPPEPPPPPPPHSYTYDIVLITTLTHQHNVLQQWVYKFEYSED